MATRLGCDGSSDPARLGGEAGPVFAPLPRHVWEAWMVLQDSRGPNGSRRRFYSGPERRHPGPLPGSCSRHPGPSPLWPRRRAHAAGQDRIPRGMLSSRRRAADAFGVAAIRPAHATRVTCRWGRDQGCDSDVTADVTETDQEEEGVCVCGGGTPGATRLPGDSAPAVPPAAHSRSRGEHGRRRDVIRDGAGT